MKGDEAVLNISIRSDLHDGVFTISLRGKIDSANAEETHDMILRELDPHLHPNRLRLDMENLSYISSAGLRILLMLKNTFSEIDIVNASPAVFSTMQMTGFTKIFNVQKAFRSVNITGCDLISSCSVSRIYKLDDATVVKVYPENTDYSLIHLEQETAQKAFVLGIPAAISYEVVRTGQQYGIAYKMADVKSLGLLISEHPDELTAYAKRLAALARTIHFTHVSDGQFQTARGVLHSVISQLRIRLTEEQYKHISALAAAIPDADTLILGDLHPNSIIFHDNRFELMNMAHICVGHTPLDLIAFHESTVNNINSSGDHERFGPSPEVCANLWCAFCRAYLAENYTPENMRILNEYLGKLGLLKTVIGKYRQYEEPLNRSDKQESNLHSMTEALLRLCPESLHDEAVRVTAFLPNP